MWNGFLLTFWMVFPPFFRRPTLDLTAICSRFVGCCFFRKVGKSTKKDSKTPPKWLPKCSQKPPKIHPKTKPKNNLKNHRIWLPKWSQNRAKMEGKTLPLAPSRASQIAAPVFDRFGTPLGSLLAPFGCLWASFWRLLAPFG